MPIQQEEINRLNNTITKIHNLISHDDLEDLLASLSNFPNFLKEAIKDNQFAVYVEIKQESPGNAAFNVLFNKHDSIHNFIKEVLLQINNNYWGHQEDNKVGIDDYINQMDANWSSKRNSTYPYKYIVNISNVAGTIRGGFNPELDCIRLNYDFGENYDDINNPACILAHELTHAVDYNRDSRTYSSCSNIAYASSEDITSILRIFGVNDQFYDPIKAQRELITYTIQSFLAYEEIIFKQQLSSIQPAAERERSIEIIKKCVHDYQQALQPRTVECLEKILMTLDNINVYPSVSSQQVLTNSDSKFIIEVIAPKIKMLDWLPESAIDYINGYSDQEKLQSELKDSNGTIGIWFLIQCLNDPKKCVNGWEALSLQQQLEKYNALVDRFKIEQGKNNPYIQRLKSNLQPPIVLIKQLFGENRQIFEQNYHDGVRRIQDEQLMERTGVEKVANFDLLQTNEYLGRKEVEHKENLKRGVILMEEEQFTSCLQQQMSQFGEQFVSLQQEAIVEKERLFDETYNFIKGAFKHTKFNKEEIEGRIEILFQQSQELLKIQQNYLSFQETQDRNSIIFEKINSIFELLRSRIETEPSWAMMFLTKFEEIIRNHQQQMAETGVDRIHLRAIMELQNQQLAQDRQQLQIMHEQGLQQIDLRPHHATQVTQADRVPLHQQPTVSSRNKKR